MFNAKAFATGTSAFCSIWKCNGFLLVALLIVVGQILIVTFGGEMFSVTPLSTSDWWQLILTTSIVAIIGEIFRFSAHIFDRCKKR
jgi:Ca2+-transporting ATPase